MTAGNVLALSCLSRKLEDSCEAHAPWRQVIVQGLQENGMSLFIYSFSLASALFSQTEYVIFPAFFFFTHPFGKWSQFLEQVRDLIGLLR